MDEKDIKMRYNEAMSIIKGHIEQKNAVKDFLKNRRYDRNDNHYRKMVGKDAMIVLNATAAEMRKIHKDNLETYKLTDYYLKRRQSAIMEYAPIFAEKFEDAYPDMIIEESLMDFCSQKFFFLPDDFVETYISLALAIAILDKLYDDMLIWDVLPYIPNSEEILSKVKLPCDYQDAVYDNDLLKGMMYLITHRDNTDDIFYNVKTVKRTKENTPKRNYITFKSNDDSNSIETRTSQHKVIDAMSCRERLDVILSAIRPEVFEKSEQTFRDKTTEFMDIVLSNTCSYEQDLIKYITELCDIYEKLCNHEEKMADALKREKKQAEARNSRSKTKPKPKPYHAPINIGDGLMGNMSPVVIDAIPNANIVTKKSDLDEYEQMVGMITKMDKIYEQIHANKEMQSELFTEKERYYNYSANYFLWKYNSIDSPDEHKKIAELLTDVEKFTIDDPYDICFGFFSLLESGDDIVWLLPLAGAVLSKAVERLPWMNIRNELELSRHLGSSSEKQTDAPIDKTDDNDDKNIDPSIMYNLCYTDYIDLANKGAKHVRKDDLMQINFAQLIYRQTGVNIARANYLHESDIRNLVK